MIDGQREQKKGILTTRASLFVFVYPAIYLASSNEDGVKNVLTQK